MIRVVAMLAALAALVTAAVPCTATAAVPCRDRIYNDWYRDGKIASSYPLSCYRDALGHIRPDAATYSSLADDIRSAMQAAILRRHGHKNVPAQVGKGLQPTSARTMGPNAHHARGVDDAAAAPTMTIAAAPTSGGGGIPLPILVLGGVALLLVAVGAVGTGVRRYRNRP
jgi:hypothetical protein